MKLEVIETFKFANSNSIKNLKRKNPNLNVEGFYYEGDTFECDEKTADLLLRHNVVIVIEQPKEVESVEVEPVEEKPKKGKKTTKSKRELTNNKKRV